MTYVLDKSRLSIRLVPPYSEERKAAASAYAKEHEMCIRDSFKRFSDVLDIRERASFFGKLVLADRHRTLKIE